MREAGHRPQTGGILIIDDDAVSRLMLRRILTKFTAARVSEASDGVRGLEMARAEQPQIIFLDSQMPEKDGLDVLRELKSDSELKRVPVVMVTGSSDPDHVKAAAKLGASGHLAKPVSFQHIEERVGHLLDSLDVDDEPDWGAAVLP